MDYLLATVGLLSLIAGGDVLVRGSVSLASRARISPLLIGLTVVAFGTSAPELVVSLDAAIFANLPELALGNAVGSNIANILLVLGVPAIIYPMVCSAHAVRRDTLAMIFTTIVFVLLCLTGEITRWNGTVLILMLAGYMAYSAKQARAHPEAIEEELAGFESPTLVEKRPVASVLFILGGIAGLVIGAELVVDGAIGIARSMGVSEATIGLTMIALGTSLPELATSIAAALRKHCDVAIGNVIGSNMFNILGVIGITALVHPIPVDRDFLTVNLWVMLAAALCLLPFGYFRLPITRSIGIILIVVYVAYIAYVL